MILLNVEQESCRNEIWSGKDAKLYKTTHFFLYERRPSNPLSNSPIISFSPSQAAKVFLKFET